MDIETKALSERHARTLIQKRGGEFCPPSKEEMHSPEIENNRHSGSARMKERLFAGLLFISILSFASCGKDSATDPATNADPIDLTFNATSALSDVLEIPAGESLWENAETFGVYVASADPTRNVSASLAVKEGKSSGTVRVNHFETGNTASFYYPYSKENDDKGMQNITCTIAATQSQGEAGVFDAANMPMASLVQTLNAETASPAQTVEMHALGGILRVKVHASGQYAGETLLSVEYSDEKTPMAGSFTLDLSALKSESALVAPECDGHSVKTTLSGGASYAVPVSADAAKAVHAVMAAGSYDGTLTLTTDKAVYTQPASCKVERGACCDLTVDLSTTESRQTIDGLWNGSGTAEDPYQIATADDLELLATFCNDASKNSEYADKHYRQTKNIDLTNVAFTAVGNTEATAFKGSYDGNGCTIANLKIANSGTDACGLFGYLNGATVTKISLENCDISSTALHVGGIAGKAEKSTVSDCTVGGSVIGTAEAEFDGYDVSSVGGMVGYALDSEISGCTLKGSLRAISLIGGMTGYASGTKISNCTVDAAATVDAEKNFLGGIAGRARFGSTIEECTVNGKISSYNGNYIGGITGHLTSGHVSGCKLTASASLSSKGNHTGGVVGALQPNEEASDDPEGMTAAIENCENAIMVFGAQNVGGIAGYQGGKTIEHTAIIKDCVSRSSVTGYKHNAGGITGLIESYGDSFIENCKSYGDILSSAYNVGGICGYAVSKGETTINYCIAYGNCRGLYSVGGICGYAKSNDAGCIINLVNCIYAGKEIEATGNNGSNGYTLATGLLGWLQVASGKATIVNCASRVQTIKTASSCDGFPSTNNTMSGILGFQNGAPAGAEVYATYSTINRDGFLTDGESTTTSYYGGTYAKIHAGSYEITSFDYCYYSPSTGQPGPGVSHLTKLDHETVKAYGEMSQLLAVLNTAVAAYDGVCGHELKKWVLDSDGYPILEGMTTMLPVSNTKRISVIGDSISTFRGFVPSGYGCHYPTSDHDLTSVSQTYWYRLAYDLMSDARIERNISFSGTAVARTTNTSYSSQSWFGQDFCARFIAQDGVGQPDIILIHGGTNDYAHNVDKLAPGVEMRSPNAPSDDVLAQLFATADAATTRAEIEALDDTSFCSAYIKLLCLIRERYPEAKVVCIIGDYLSTGIEQSTIKIAEHYGAKSVDLYAVNGFNDQTYMPKHDYNPSTGSGCHPSSKAMEYIANKIYPELGSWLEE